SPRRSCRRAALRPVAPPPHHRGGVVNDGLGAPQSVFVLGGTSDIGLAVLRALAGGPLTTVVLAGRHPDALEAAGADLAGHGVKEVDVVAFDADDVNSHEALIDGVFDR